MEAKAQVRYLRVTPQKARRVVDTIRGKRAEEAPDDKAMCKLPFCSELLARYARVPRTILIIVLNRQRQRPAAIGFIDRDFG